jgi:hypothetical protein
MVMNLKQTLQQIEQLQKVDIPWQVMRTFGKLELLGNQVCFRSNDDNDYVTMHELQFATEWLIEQLGGKVKWSKK